MLVAKEAERKHTRLGYHERRTWKGKEREGQQQQGTSRGIFQTYLDNITIAVLSNPEDVGGWRVGGVGRS
jgi:hypothetical protein